MVIYDVPIPTAFIFVPVVNITEGFELVIVYVLVFELLIVANTLSSSPYLIVDILFAVIFGFAYVLFVVLLFELLYVDPPLW